MPTLTFLGHAGLAVDTEDFRLLADPWFADTGAFLGAWHQFPRNDHLDLDGLLDAEWVAASHEHLDHMDLSVLTRLPERTRVLIPKYPSSAFRDRLRAGVARRVIELEPWQRFPLDTRGSWITAIPEQSPVCNDAAFLIVTAGHAVLNCNDARLTAAQARRAKHLAGGRLDVMAVQTSGASWHPICYSYPPEVRGQSRQTSELASSGSIPPNPCGAARIGRTVCRAAMFPRPGTAAFQYIAAAARYLPGQRTGRRMAPRTSARSGVGVLPPRRPDRPRHRRGHPRPGLRPVQLHRRHRRVPRPVRG